MQSISTHPPPLLALDAVAVTPLLLTDDDACEELWALELWALELD
jgi:hypothetical protein